MIVKRAAERIVADLCFVRAMNTKSETAKRASGAPDRGQSTNSRHKIFGTVTGGAARMARAAQNWPGDERQAHVANRYTGVNFRKTTPDAIACIVLLRAQ